MKVFNCFLAEGEYIIESLILACLLERVEYSEDFVKIHSFLIHDVALELASENSNKTCAKSCWVINFPSALGVKNVHALYHDKENM